MMVDFLAMYVNMVYGIKAASVLSFGRHIRSLYVGIAEQSHSLFGFKTFEGGKLLFFRNFAWQKMPRSNRTSTLRGSVLPSHLTKSLVSGNCFVRPDKKGEVRPKTSLIFRTRRRKSRARLNILLRLSLSLPSLLCIVRCVVAGILAKALDASSALVPWSAGVKR